MPYHLATPHRENTKAKGRSRRSGPPALRSYGVGDGTRTHDTRNHNPMLYQLNYTHHIGKLRENGDTRLLLTHLRPETLRPSGYA